MNLNERFNNQTFNDWVEQFLPGFSRDLRKVDIPRSFSGVNSIHTIGESSLGVRVYTIEMETDPSKRKIGLATDSFSLLRNYGTPNAIAVYYSEDSTQWRLSLLTSTPVWNEGKIITKLSNPKRQSYVLGPKAKVKTPHQYLISKGSVADFADLKSRFSLEVVNKEFYKEISHAFIKLVGGTLANGRSKQTFKPILRLPFVAENSQTSMEFAVRLIGRIIFCWFLREKKSASGNTLMPKELLSSEASKSSEDYYHRILEPIFFEILNKPIKSRKEAYVNELFSAIPYLNGGLFSPHEDDFYNYNEGKQAVNHNMVIVPDEWLRSLFEVLETYNFTIDENTSFDEELSIDPEMLGRIFENLLAEINPETGESARKSTGSYYTPRVIVDYMVDESLKLYIKTKTSVSEEKLQALISYDLEDDEANPLNSEEKDKIAEALGKIKILDPACGSGAFPIGALQKIVFILQQIDQNGQLWFKKQIQNTPVELRRVIEREFQEKNFDYIRKLGIIRENIYGIDIQPIATEISRLRCFLTLVVDERVDDTLENRGIEPLPNLDFKFVTANTLVGLPTTNGSASQMGLFEDDQGIKDLKEVRDMFFNASGFERDQLKLQFSQTQNRMLHKLIDESRRGHAEMTAKLTSWDPFSHKTSSWFDPEWMFGIKTGFDVVIGNPPYIGLNKVDKDLVKILKDSYKEIHTGYNDLLYYFIYWGTQTLSDKGIFCMIVANYFIGNTYAKPLRKYLNNKLIKIINFKAHHVFEQANVHTSIVFANKTIADKFVFFYNLGVQGRLEKTDLTNVLPISISRESMVEDWVIADISSEKIIRKLFINHRLLSDIAVIEKGSSSGKNDVFTISSGTASNYKIENTILKKNVKNSEIKKYYIPQTDNLLIYTDKDVDINLFPNTLNYLTSHKSELKSRNEVKQGLYPWYRLERPRDKKIFDAEEKLLVPYRAKTNTFAYDDQQYFNDGGDVRAIVLKESEIENFSIKYILALLNSKLFNWYYGFIGKPKGDVREYFNKPLGIIPIKDINPTKQKLFVEVINKLITLLRSDDYHMNANKQEIVKKYQRDIDQMVYNLFELGEDEIKIIESYYA